MQWESIGETLAPSIGRTATRYRAPLALRAQIESLVSGVVPAPAVAPPASAPLLARWLLPAGGWVLAGVLATTLLTRPGAPVPPAPTPEPYRDSYARALVTGHSIDVASSDRHTVKPWFRGRLDYAPPVPDLSHEGFLLVGARLDYVLQRPQAVLVYQRRQHFIDVFVTPLDAPAAPGGSPAPAPQAPDRGYQVVRGQTASMRYIAVSDLDASELRGFAAAYALASAAAQPLE